MAWNIFFTQKQILQMEYSKYTSTNQKCIKTLAAKQLAHATK